jgi:hypothetical protein
LTPRWQVESESWCASYISGGSATELSATDAWLGAVVADDLADDLNMGTNFWFGPSGGAQQCVRGSDLACGE